MGMAAFLVNGRDQFSNLSFPHLKERVDRGVGGGGDTGIRGRGTGIKGAGNGDKGGRGRGKRGRGAGEEGAGVRKFWGRVLYENLLYFTDFSLFLCTSMQ